MTVAMIFSATVRFQERPSHLLAAAAGGGLFLATQTRYEGWFLIPFVALFLLLTGGKIRWSAAIMAGAFASAGPISWLAHNWWYYGDALEFYHGQYSAKAIYQRALNQGMGRYAGDHQWNYAWLYFREAARLCAGQPLAWAGVIGLTAALVRRAWWPVALLGLSPVFYIWSIHSSGTPIFVPHLWPHSWYNTRYGLAALPLLALGAGSLAGLLPSRFRPAAAGVILAGCVFPWLVTPAPDGWITWKESSVNSEARRAWTWQAAEYLRSHRKPHEGVFTSSGDVMGVYRHAGIPFRDTLNDGNNPHFEAAIQRPDLFLWEPWAVAIAGDKVSGTLVKSNRFARKYRCVKTITVKGAPPVEIYRREDTPAAVTLR
jgi:hypothetical protein